MVQRRQETIGCGPVAAQAEGYGFEALLQQIYDNIKKISILLDKTTINYQNPYREPRERSVDQQFDGDIAQLKKTVFKIQYIRVPLAGSTA